MQQTHLFTPVWFWRSTSCSCSVSTYCTGPTVCSDVRICACQANTPWTCIRIYKPRSMLDQPSRAHMMEHGAGRPILQVRTALVIAGSNLLAGAQQPQEAYLQKQPAARRRQIHPTCSAQASKAVAHHRKWMLQPTAYSFARCFQRLCAVGRALSVRILLPGA